MVPPGELPKNCRDALVLGWVLNLAYTALLVAISPVLVYRALVQGKYRAGWREKMWGHAPRRESTGPCVWLHAVSVGEVLLLRTIISELQSQRPDVEVWISTTTHTGHAVAREKYPDCRVFYYPLDFTWAVRNALQRVRPDVIGLAELELWPNFIRAAAAHGATLLLINGRLSERSFRGYSRIRALIRDVLQRFDGIGVQNDEYRDRFITLGARPERVITTGSVKFDGVAGEPDRERIRALRRELKIGEREPVLVAGSTHAPEEAIVLAAYQSLLTDYPGLRLIMAPRHRERFDEVAQLIEQRGFGVLRRSAARSAIEIETGGKSAAAASGPTVILLDTLGELTTVWGLAEVAFVGGSLCRRGGQNMLEPCAYGAATLCGPNTWHFRQIVEQLVAAGGLMVVSDADKLQAAIAHFLAHPDEAHLQGARACAVVRSQQGATERTAAMLLQALGDAVRTPGSVAA